MATAPAYAATPNTGFVNISTANTARDGTGTLGIVFTAGASGSRIDRITITARATTTAGVVRLYISDGTNHALYSEHLVSAITPSATVAVFATEIIPNIPITLKSGQTLRASTHNAESFTVAAFGGDF
jgi:hypothetical protein